MITPFGHGSGWNGKDRDVGVANHFFGRGADKDSIHAASPGHPQNDEINRVLIRNPQNGVSRYSFGKDGFNFHIAAPGLGLDLFECVPRLLRNSLLFRIEDGRNFGSLVGDPWPLVNDVGDDDSGIERSSQVHSEFESLSRTLREIRREQYPLERQRTGGVTHRQDWDIDLSQQ
jgi:hypothetical protein